MESCLTRFPAPVGRQGKGFIVTGLRKARFFALDRRTDGWRPGTHMITADCNKCSMELGYKVTVLPVLPSEVAR